MNAIWSLPSALVFAEVIAAAVLMVQAISHINRQTVKTVFLVTVGWGLLGAAAMRVMVEASDGVPADPLRTLLLVQVALAVLFDRREWERRRVITKRWCERQKARKAKR